MPADPVEIHDAEAEGVKLEFLAAPVGIVKGADGRVAGLACIRMELGEPDASGRRRPVPVKGSEHVVAADHVYSAIGQESILDGVAEPGCGVATTKWKTIVADEETLATALPGVFAGGDVVSGPDVVIGAIAHGRKAALSIDEYLRTGKVGKKAKRFVSRKDDHGIPEWEWEREKRARAAAPEEDPAARTAGFGEVTMHLMPETVAAETMRCLECGCQVYPSCELRKIADEYGVAVSRFKGEVKKSRVDDRHPFIRIDNNKCVLCARCIRTCADTLGVTALGFVGRGFRTEVHPAMNKALQETTCVSCGNCADACPTGAIITRLPYVAKLLPVEAARTATTCTGCSLGCRRSVEAAARGLFWIAATGLGDETADNRGYLCLKGRYNIRHLLGADRLAAPLVRSGGALAEASWEKALDAAAAGIGGVAARHGPAGVALLAAPDRTSEELYLAQKYARVALGTSNVGSLSLAQAAGPAAVLGRAFGLPASTVGPAEVGAADVIVVAASDVDEESFVAGVLVKQAVKKGALLVVVGGRAGTLARCAEVVIPAQGEGGAAGALDEIARLAGGKEKVVALLGARAGEKECAALVGLMIATGKADKEGSGILLLEDHGNAQGARDMGIDPAFLPGYREAPREGKGALKGARSMDELVAALKDGTVKGLVAVGEDPAADPQLAPLLGKLEFLVVLEGSLTATAAAAHVVLPLASIVETDGTVTSSGRRVQRVRKAFEPACGKEGYQVLGELIARTSGAKVPVRALDAWEEIRPLFAPLAGIDLATLDEKPFSWRLPGSGVKPVKADGAAPAARHPFLQVEKEYATLRETYLPTGGKPPL